MKFPDLSHLTLTQRDRIIAAADVLFKSPGVCDLGRGPRKRHSDDCRRCNSLKRYRTERYGHPAKEP